MGHFPALAQRVRLLDKQAVDMGGSEKGHTDRTLQSKESRIDAASVEGQERAEWAQETGSEKQWLVRWSAYLQHSGKAKQASFSWGAEAASIPRAPG
jgi:hypothetical protein